MSCGVFVLPETSDGRSRNKGGRPLKFKTVKELQTAIAAYFRSCDPHVTTVKMVIYPMVKHGKGYIYDYEAEPKVVKRKVMSEQVPYTITGLALHLKTTRDTLLDYQDREEFSDTIKDAKLKCEQYAERMLYSGKNVAGSIFNLKNNYNWKDTKQLDGTMNLRHNPYEDLSDEELKKMAAEAVKKLREEGEGE